MDLLYELQTMRAKLISEIDMSFEQLIKQLNEEQENQVSSTSIVINPSYEKIYPLSAGPSIFKGEKPTGLIFPNNTRVDVSTWKKVAEAILKDCISDKNREKLLLELRGKASGRSRTFLANTGSQMRSPIEITKDIFMETHYDTETLLRILTTRILTPVGYDYSGISVAIRNF